MNHILFWLDLCPRLPVKDYIALSDPLAGFKGPTSTGRGGREGEREVGLKKVRSEEGGSPTFRHLRSLPATQH